MEANTVLIPYVQKFFEYDPLTATHALETMDEEEAIQILTALPASVSVGIFDRLQVHHAAAYLERIPAENFNEIVERMEPERGASIFIHIADDIRTKMMAHLSDKVKKDIVDILTYPKGSVGTIMTAKYVAFNKEIKIKDAISNIRQRAHSKAPPASYLYVTDDENRLVGVINMRDLIIGDEAKALETIMIRDIFSLNAFTDREEAATQLSARKYFAAPVVDNENHLLGIVKADQLIGQAKEEASADLQKMFGVSADERVFSSIKFSLRKRLPWLYINLGTAFMAGSVVALFEGIIAKITILAVFLPVVAGQGGNAGSQSLAVVMRGLVMREISPRETGKLILKEGKLGLINGVVIGLVTALIAWGWKGNPYLGLVIGLAMIVNLVAAGLAGASIPMALKAFGIDPAQSSAIVLTTVTDIIGFFAFLGFAVIFQSYLI
ncbi:MAG: magnesium transporter MgtE [Thermodesulfobacteriota bacterium]|nr:MAG: magnesium transporter MgtE [Thermodesulfobacteriota bacterium]